MAGFDVSVAREEESRDGTKKTYWTQIGKMFPSKKGDGYTIKLNALPLPNKDGQVWISAFPEREREREKAPF